MDELFSPVECYYAIISQVLILVCCINPTCSGILIFLMICHQSLDVGRRFLVFNVLAGDLGLRGGHSVLCSMLTVY